MRPRILWSGVRFADLLSADSQIFDISIIYVIHEAMVITKKPYLRNGILLPQVNLLIALMPHGAKLL